MTEILMIIFFRIASDAMPSESKGSRRNATSPRCREGQTALPTESARRRQELDNAPLR